MRNGPWTMMMIVLIEQTQEQQVAGGGMIAETKDALLLLSPRSQGVPKWTTTTMKKGQREAHSLLL